MLIFNPSEAGRWTNERARTVGGEGTQENTALQVAYAVRDACADATVGWL